MLRNQTLFVALKKVRFKADNLNAAAKVQSRMLNNPLVYHFYT
jgi:hypothetical protein